MDDTGAYDTTVEDMDDEETGEPLNRDEEATVDQGG